MRKLILSLVFVLATGSTFMNATTSYKETLTNDMALFGCWEVADMVDNISAAYAECNGHSYSYKQSYHVWAAAYDTCMAQK
jgi:hypothetical protein